MSREIDTNLYSRQIGTIGMEAMKKLIQLKVLIVGLRGLGIETAKNIILAGPNKVSIFDPEPSNIKDLSSNFYL
jgi:ubiquitin-activating enzyme E1